MSVLKTYGVTGLVEWNTVINAGKAHMRVVFTGGALTAYGTTPATFATRNPLVQNIIERSGYFKEGRIELISAVGEEDPKPATSGGKTSESAKPETQKETGEANAGNGTQEETTSEGEVKEVEVSCLDDAKEYLRENFGVRGIRTKAEANAAATERGVKFIGW